MDDQTPGPTVPALLDSRRTRRRRLASRLILIVAVLACLALAAWLLTPSAKNTAAGGRFAGGGPQAVVGTAARTGDMPISLSGLGTVTPLATVTVKTQISGRITQIAFQEGQNVKAGDFLVQIDPRPYQVALEQAEGALARDQALLANAKVDLARYQKLFTEDSIAEQQVATQKALVLQDDGTVKTDVAAVDSARLNLVYCHITAPVSGRVGLRQVDLGNYVTSGDTNGIVVITQLQPITVLFPLPEDDLPGVIKRLHGGATLPVTAYNRSRTAKLAEGTLATVDNQADTSTGTVKLRADFPNEDESLFPNQFVNVDLLVDTQHGVTLIPQSGVQRGAPGTFVYVIDPADDTVHVRTVSLGASDAADIVATKGLQPGDLIVTDGADKLKEGARVTLPGKTPPADGTAPPAPDKSLHRHHRSAGNSSSDQNAAPQ